jgi:glycosyltransferase involved in cell wall biosynthesis
VDDGPSKTEEPESDGPRVAVIIPCFNDGEFVTEAVASAHDQERCEIVIVDDGSTDAATLRTFERLRAEGIGVVHQENQGVSAARMSGLTATSARYVQPLDSDDRLAPGVLTTLADLLDANPEVTAAWGFTTHFGVSQAISMHWSGFDPWRLTFLNEVPTTMLIRRTALDEVGGWELSEAGFEDWDLNLKGAEQGWVGMRVDLPHSYYREHAEARMLDGAIRQREKIQSTLRSRHAQLFETRRETVRKSSSRRLVKLGWSAIERLPRVSSQTKGRLFHMVRDSFEPSMRPPDAPAPLLRAWRRVQRLVQSGSKARSRG